MAKESFFSRLRDSFFGKDEVELNESIETKENKLPEPEVKNPSLLEVTPKVVQGAAEVAASFFLESPVNRRQDNELKPTRDPARLEHEPYRYNENGDGKVCITPANLYEIHPTTGSVKIHPLKTTIVEDLPRNCVVCSTFTTDDQGAVTGDYDVYVHEGGSATELADPPESTQFILPDEDGNGYGGTYYMPLFWIQSGKLERNTWEGPNRSAKLMGGVQGHRGPVWWVKGYNALSNIGGGKNVYKRYDWIDDEKELRTLKEKGMSGVSSPFSGQPQVQVRYEGEEEAAAADPPQQFDKADSNAIVVHGNRYKKQWFVGSKSRGIVEDGLVSCLSNLPVTTVPVTELSTALAGKADTLYDVCTSSITTTVVGSLVGGTVAGLPSSSNTATAITGLTTDTTFWKGGDALTAAGLTVYEVQLCGQTGCGVGKSVYVMGVSPEGYQGSSSWPSFIVGASQAAAVTAAAGQTSFLQTVPSANVITGQYPATVVASLSTVQAYLPTDTVRVYEAEDENAKKFLTHAGTETGLTVVIESTGGEYDTECLGTTT